MSRPSAEDNLVQRLQRKSQKHNNTNHKYTNKGDNISWLMEIHPPHV